MLRRIVALTLVLAIGWPGWSLAAQPPRQGQALEAAQRQARADLDRVMKVIEEMRSYIDRSEFDLEALLLKLGFEANAILDLVTTEIAFEQYPGLLRGAQGTLMSRAGNALDQAVLLATLLRDAGFEARIVEGRLSPQDAARLVTSMFARSGESPARPRAAEGLLEALPELGARAGLPPNAVEALRSRFSQAFDIRDDERFRQALQDAERLQSELANAGVVLQDLRVHDELVEEARDYFWVEYRLGPSQPWVVSHPAFHPSIGLPSSPEKLTTFSGSVPDRLLHRLRFRVVIEQRVGTRVREHEVIPAWERPVANLVGIPLSYVNVPNTLGTLEGFADVSASLRDAELFSPYFSHAPPGNSFDLNGNVIPPEALGFSASGVLRRVGAKFEKAAGALSALGTKTDSGPEDLMALTGQWLEYTVIAPGGTERTFRRSVFEDPPRENRQPAAIRQAVDFELLRTWFCRYHFMVAAGEYPQSFLLDKVLENLLLMRPVIERLIDGSDMKGLSREGFRDLGVELLTLYGTFDAFSDRGVRYRREPGLLALEERFGHDRVQVLTDIVSNRKASLALVDGDVFVNVAANLRAGAWESRTEGQVHPMNPAMSVQMPAVLDDPSGEAALRVFASVAALNRVDLPSSLDSEMRRELADGSVVVLPTLPSGVVQGYWSIDPKTGAALAKGLGNRGVSATEYMILLTGASFLGALVMMVPCVIILARVTSLSGCDMIGSCAGLGMGLGQVGAPIAAGIELTGPAGVAVVVGFVLGTFLIDVAIGAYCPGSPFAGRPLGLRPLC